MQDYFFALVEQLMAGLNRGESLICSVQAEESDFVRLNRNRIRQAGSVVQRAMSVDLIEGERHAAGRCELEGVLDRDLVRLRGLLGALREQRDYLPLDPYLNYATEVIHSERLAQNQLPETGLVIEQVLDAAKGLDLVGIWASGVVYRGLASSWGQRNWHASATFNLDWSCYCAADKAVKCSYAGLIWDVDTLWAKMDAVRTQLRIMSARPVTIEAGRYRVYMAPTALREIMDMMAWEGYGLKSHRASRTPLIKMVREGRRLAPSVTLTEQHGRGLVPTFTKAGFIKPDHVSLIENGAYADCLTGARSAKEYGAVVNSSGEYPNSLDLAAGTLGADEILTALDRGLYVNNLWYCNFSDHSDCRITGTTRFACFWVRDGRIVGPVNVMRFDDTVYRMLGDQLLGLTEQRELLFDAKTYGRRSLRSYLLPGALVGQLTFTG